LESSTPFVVFLCDGWVNLLLIGWALADMVRYPKEAWRKAGESRASWMGAIALSTLIALAVLALCMIARLGFVPAIVLGNFGLVIAGYYLARVRPRLRSVSTPPR
jgi:hypothetical protein